MPENGSTFPEKNTEQAAKDLGCEPILLDMLLGLVESVTEKLSEELYAIHERIDLLS